MADNIQIYIALNDPYQKPTQLNLQKVSHKYMYHKVEDTAEVSILPINTTYLSTMYDSYYQQPLCGAINFHNTTYLPINAVPSGTAGCDFREPTQ
jgi:hypothetical protein